MVTTKATIDNVALMVITTSKRGCSQSMSNSPSGNVLNRDDKVDPDPWTMIGLVIGVVSMVGTLAQVALAYKTTPKNPFQPDGAELRESVADALDRAVKSAEKLLTFLQKVPDQNVLDAEFSFAATTMMLTPEDLGRYGMIGHDVAHSVADVHARIDMLLRFQPDMAAEIGRDLLVTVDNLADRINGYYRNKRSNEEVIADCLLLLRTFITIIAKLDN